MTSGCLPFGRQTSQLVGREIGFGPRVSCTVQSYQVQIGTDKHSVQQYAYINIIQMQAAPYTSTLYACIYFYRGNYNIIQMNALFSIYIIQ